MTLKKSNQIILFYSFCVPQKISEKVMKETITLLNSNQSWYIYIDYRRWSILNWIELNWMEYDKLNIEIVNWGKVGGRGTINGSTSLGGAVPNQTKLIVIGGHKEIGSTRDHDRHDTHIQTPKRSRDHLPQFTTRFVSLIIMYLLCMYIYIIILFLPSKFQLYLSIKYR